MSYLLLLQTEKLWRKLKADFNYYKNYQKWKQFIKKELQMQKKKLSTELLLHFQLSASAG